MFSHKPPGDVSMEPATPTAPRRSAAQPPGRSRLCARRSVPRMPRHWRRGQRRPVAGARHRKIERVGDAGRARRRADAALPAPRHWRRRRARSPGRPDALAAASAGLPVSIAHGKYLRCDGQADLLIAPDVATAVARARRDQRLSPATRLSRSRPAAKIAALARVTPPPRAIQEGSYSTRLPRAER
jgi:hypothetical protein